MKFPVFSQLAGNWPSETSSLVTASSSRESRANRDVDDLALISRGSQDRCGRDRRGGRASSVTMAAQCPFSMEVSLTSGG
jgi:hypothetical protein